MVFENWAQSLMLSKSDAEQLLQDRHPEYRVDWASDWVSYQTHGELTVIFGFENCQDRYRLKLYKYGQKNRELVVPCLLCKKLSSEEVKSYGISQQSYLGG